MVNAAALRDPIDAWELRIEGLVTNGMNLESLQGPLAHNGSAPRSPVLQSNHDYLEQPEPTSGLLLDKTTASSPLDHGLTLDATSTNVEAFVPSIPSEVSPVSTSLVETGSISVASSSERPPACSESEHRTAPLPVSSGSDDDSDGNDSFWAQAESDATSPTWGDVDYCSDDLSLAGMEPYFDLLRQESLGGSSGCEDGVSDGSFASAGEESSESSDPGSDSEYADDAVTLGNAAEPGLSAGKDVSSEESSQSEDEDAQAQPQASPTPELILTISPCTTPIPGALSDGSRERTSSPQAGDSDSEESQRGHSPTHSAHGVTPADSGSSTLYSDTGRPMRRSRLRSSSGSSTHYDSIRLKATLTAVQKKAETKTGDKTHRKGRAGKANAANTFILGLDEEDAESQTASHGATSPAPSSADSSELQSTGDCTEDSLDESHPAPTQRLVVKIMPRRTSPRLASRAQAQVSGSSSSSSSRDASGRKPGRGTGPPALEVVLEDENEKALATGSSTATMRRTRRVQSGSRSSSSTRYNDATSEASEATTVPKAAKSKASKTGSGKGKGKASRYEHYDSLIARALGPADIASMRQKLQAAKLNKDDIPGWHPGDLIVHPDYHYRRPRENSETRCRWIGCNVTLSTENLDAHLQTHVSAAEAVEGTANSRGQHQVSCRWDGCKKPPMLRQSLKRHMIVSDVVLTEAVCPWPGCDWTKGQQDWTLTRHLNKDHDMSQDSPPFILRPGSDAFIRGAMPTRN